MRIIARHKWLEGCTITESVDDKKLSANGEFSYTRFTATIRKYRNWKIWEGFISEGMAIKVRDKVKEIRDLIDSGDQEIFNVKGYFIDGK